MKRPHLSRVLALGLLVPTFLGACTSDDPRSGSPTSVSGVPAEPPWGLGSAGLPSNQEEIDAVLAAMPTELDGLVGSVGGNEIGYGDTGMGEVAGSMETFLRIMTIGGEEYGEGASFIGAIAQGGGIEVEGQDLDPGSPVVYLAGLTPTGDVTYASVMWAAPSARYVLLIQGTSPDQREALIAAYEQAATEALG